MDVLEIDHARYLDRDVCAYMGIGAAAWTFVNSLKSVLTDELRQAFEAQPAIIEVTTKSGAVYTALRVRVSKSKALDVDGS